MFETRLEKFMLVAFVVLSFTSIAVLSGFNPLSLVGGPDSPNIGSSNYPDFVRTVELGDLGVTVNPYQAIVSPDRTPFVDIIYRFDNNADTARVLRLYIPEPSTVITDDPRFVISVSRYEVQDGNVTHNYKRVVLYLNAGESREFKWRYENAYEALDRQVHTVRAWLENEGGEEVADLSVTLYSNALGFEDIWRYSALPVDGKKITLFTGSPSFTEIPGTFIYWAWGRDGSGGFTYNSYSATVPVQADGTLRFRLQTYVSNSNYARIDYFRVRLYDGEEWNTVYECSLPANQGTACPGNRVIEIPLRGAKSVKFEARLGGRDGHYSRIRVLDLDVEGTTPSWHAVYYKEGTLQQYCGNPCENGVTLDIPDGKYRGFLVLVDGGDSYCYYDWVKVYVHNGNEWLERWSEEAGDFCGNYRGWVDQPVWIDTSDLQQVTQVKVVWRYKSNPQLRARVYMVPYDFPTTVEFQEVCDENTVHTLTAQVNGPFAELSFPETSCTELSERTLNEVTVRTLYESVQRDLALDLFYDPGRVDDLLWEKYDAWVEEQMGGK